MPRLVHILLQDYTPVTWSPRLGKIVRLQREHAISLSLRLKQLLLATARVMLLDGVVVLFRVWDTSDIPISSQSKGLWKLLSTHPAHGSQSLLLPGSLRWAFANTLEMLQPSGLRMAAACSLLTAIAMATLPGSLLI